nr:MAG TPA: hypothetical protein [Caudoviricetes sp.]
MLIKDNYATAEFKDIVKYKIKWTFKIPSIIKYSIKWIFKIIYKFYMNYVELYDFDNLL